MPAAALGPAFDLISYDDCVQRPRAPERMARLKQSLAQGCNEEAGEVTGWPIDQIQSAVQPDERQSLMLDDLGNAVVKASDEIRAHCQTNIAFTPTGRLAQMHDRLGALVDSVNIVSPLLSAFYDSLNDEQKSAVGSHRPVRAAPRPGRAERSHYRDHSRPMRRRHDGVANRSDRSRGAARRCAARQAASLAIGGFASRRYDQGRLSGRDVPPAPPARLAAVGRLQAIAAKRRDDAAGAS
jgi:hypothetical protein